MKEARDFDVTSEKGPSHTRQALTEATAVKGGGHKDLTLKALLGTGLAVDHIAPSYRLHHYTGIADKRGCAGHCRAR